MDHNISQAIDQIKSGEINDLYPILKPGDWVGIKAGAVCQAFLGSEDDPKLVIGMGYNTPENFIFLMKTQIEGQDAQAVLRQAHANLEQLEATFDPIDLEMGKILTASGKDFSSEKILCTSHNMKMHELLGAEELLVSIPRRRCMMAIARNASEELLESFITLHQYTWNDDSYGNAPIINGLFVVKEGDITGFISLE